MADKFFFTDFNCYVILALTKNPVITNAWESVMCPESSKFRRKTMLATDKQIFNHYLLMTIFSLFFQTLMMQTDRRHHP